MAVDLVELLREKPLEQNWHHITAIKLALPPVRVPFNMRKS